MNVNGWNTIRTLLARNGQNQNDLARFLNISAPAISQIKHEKVKLSGERLEKICRHFNATNAEKQALFEEVINARLFGTEKLTVKVKK